MTATGVSRTFQKKRQSGTSIVSGVSSWYNQILLQRAQAGSFVPLHFGALLHCLSLRYTKIRQCDLMITMSMGKPCQVDVVGLTVAQWPSRAPGPQKWLKWWKSQTCTFFTSKHSQSPNLLKQTLSLRFGTPPSLNKHHLLLPLALFLLLPPLHPFLQPSLCLPSPHPSLFHPYFSLWLPGSLLRHRAEVFAGDFHAPSVESVMAPSALHSGGLSPAPWGSWGGGG